MKKEEVKELFVNDSPYEGNTDFQIKPIKTDIGTLLKILREEIEVENNNLTESYS